MLIALEQSSAKLLLLLLLLLLYCLSVTRSLCAVQEHCYLTVHY